MLRFKPLTDIDTKDLYETCQVGVERMKARVIQILCMAMILMLIYPYQIILAWYFPMMVLDFINFKYEKSIVQTIDDNATLKTKTVRQYFTTAWLESLCMVAFIIALSIDEGQITHFAPYLILLCISIYTATSTFHNAVLMFGHLVLYNFALIFISLRDVVLSYPNTHSTLWVQLFASILIVFFITDSYKFFHKIYLDRRKKSQEVDQARKQAENLTRQKSDLISAIGHELRTPLNGILGFSQIIKRTELSKKQQEYVELIEGAGKDLHLLLSNILDSENLEQGRFRVCLAETDLRVILNRIVKTFEIPAIEKGITLHLDIDHDMPTRLLIDETRLGQCVSNLLSNAVRFTQSGRIVVRASYRSNPEPTLLISVTDTGIGIPNDQTGIIFDKFVQGTAPSGLQSGTGLGLWLVRSIAKVMNGTLTLVQTSPQGSEFLLAFDLETPALKPLASDTPLAKKRILHIEDTHTNLMLVRFMLEEHGVIVTEAKTGSDAIALLRNGTFDAILCDLQLPDCNGNQLLEKIRALGNGNADIPVIALTAQPEKIDKTRQNNSFTGILAKPINQDLLISTLSQLQSNNQVL